LAEEIASSVDWMAHEELATIVQGTHAKYLIQGKTKVQNYYLFEHVLLSVLQVDKVFARPLMQGTTLCCKRAPYMPLN
jgi:hypothetical protein